ncbi:MULTISPECIES: ABC transporter permease [Comamonas]|uniref:ABC transporter permease n=1 Tax=Comamonas TaxID=283 RepID=UPI0009B9089A|nr:MULTISPECIES: FtsX-like permease family protein [Comamonas]TZG11055.1 FtsX-like permease family protein [Comamonas thiooxydans]UNV91986.1 ABC transporter permease [Comamonas sp. 7D-2evo1]UNV94714.1 ABC transporter permease [Comamonas sp. 7D-2]UNW01622.1 ABC transporter permease [Comamonas sp. 7D-2evo2]
MAAGRCAIVQTMQASSVWILGLRNLWRDLRAGELRLIIVAVLLAVAALSSVGFFADRLQAGLQRDARQLLGGDVVVVSDNPAPAVFVQQARQQGLQTVATASFPTMARAAQEQGGASRLVALKSVEPGYPLRGVLHLNQGTGQPDLEVRAIPESGHAWVDAPLLEALGLKLGDRLLLGDASFHISHIIAIEPDRGAGFMSFAPRVMINSADLPATRLVQPASRITYRLAVAAQADAGRGAERAAQDYLGWAQELAKSLHGVRVESLESGRPEMRQTLDRAEKFLSLVALLSALLSAVAVALAARAFANSHLDASAMLRVLGQSQRRIALAYVVEFVSIALAASAAGVLLGWAVHHVFVWLLAGLVESALPAASLWPALFGMGMGLTLLLAFGLPPVLQLAQVPPLRVMRRDLGALKPASWLVLGVGVTGFAALLMVASRDIKLGLIAVGGFAVAVLLFAGLAWLAVKLLRQVVNEATAPRWLVMATRQVSAKPVYAVVQVSSLAVGLLALVLLVLLRTDLIASWRKATPANAPDRFVINVQPDQAQDFQAALKKAGVHSYDWYPMIRGRLIAVNDKAVSPDDYEEDRAKRLVDREFNISTAETMPDHNQIVGGRWQAGEQGAISMEEGIAKTLGLKLGDTLRFDIGGEESEARITSLRKVDWSSMRANFFVIYPVQHLENVAVTYLAAYRAPDIKGFDNALVNEFPNITNVDLSSTLAQVQQVMDQVIRAVEFLFGFTLVAGLVVLFASVTGTREERAREYAIMRAVGARSGLLQQVQSAELAGVGLMAGFLASCVALAVGWALARWVFDFEWNVLWWVPLVGALAGALLAWLAGWWALREVVSRPVMITLRQAAE